MYKSDTKLQTFFLDFNQPMGLHMNPEKRWIKMADMVPGDVFEKKYKHFFKSKTGNIAKTLRIGAKMPMEANEYLIQKNQPDKKEDNNGHHNPPSGDGSGKTEESENKGTLTIDATCAPVYIRYP